ncbi:MAG: hypothetical protein AAGF60_16420 [Pseudomonadota bacterium]
MLLANRQAQSGQMTAECVYGLRFEGVATSQLALGGTSKGNCPASGTVTVTANPAQGVDVAFPAFHPEPLTIAGIQLPNAPSPLPSGYDLLGVSLDQTRDDVEANLVAGRGWTALERGVQGSATGMASLRSGAAHRAFQSYVKTTDIIETSARGAKGYVDQIDVLFEFAPTEEAAAAGTARVLGVSRTTYYSPAGQNVPIPTMKSALQNKFGFQDPEIDIMFQRTTFTISFDQTGAYRQLVWSASSGECSEADRASGVRGISVGDMHTFPSCGPEVDINVTSNDDGSIRKMVMDLGDASRAYNDELLGTLLTVDARVNQMLETAAAPQDAPEL